MPTMSHQNMQWCHLNPDYASSLRQHLWSRGEESFPFRPFNQNHRAMLMSKLLRILGCIPAYLLIEIVVEGAQGNTSSARVGASPSRASSRWAMKTPSPCSICSCETSPIR